MWGQKASLQTNTSEKTEKGLHLKQRTFTGRESIVSSKKGSGFWGFSRPRAFLDARAPSDGNRNAPERRPDSQLERAQNAEVIS